MYTCLCTKTPTRWFGGGVVRHTYIYIGCIMGRNRCKTEFDRASLNHLIFQNFTPFIFFGDFEAIRPPHTPTVFTVYNNWLMYVVVITSENSIFCTFWHTKKMPGSWVNGSPGQAKVTRVHLWGGPLLQCLPAQRHPYKYSDQSGYNCFPSIRYSGRRGRVHMHSHTHV
jgi:hypothetical protein